METRYEEASKVTILAILWNVFLSVIKIFSGVIGNSTAMIADGIHSASDIITSVGVLIGNKISSKPGDIETSISSFIAFINISSATLHTITATTIVAIGSNIL